MDVNASVHCVRGCGHVSAFGGIRLSKVSVDVVLPLEPVGNCCIRMAAGSVMSSRQNGQ
jgi:hypothetical protein